MPPLVRRFLRTAIAFLAIGLALGVWIMVAREFGVKASAERVRNNPNYKREICRLVGRDIRVQEACVDEATPGRDGRR